MKMKKASKRKRIWFWLTCWRPMTKYEYAKTWEFFMKFGMAAEKDHIKFQNDILALKAQVGLKKKEAENIERGMYL